MTIPAALDQMTDGWLRGALAAGDLNDAAGAPLHIERIGVGTGFTSEIVRVSWPSAADGDAPTSAVLKLAGTPDDYERCAREVRFFDELAPHVDLPLPRVYWSTADPGSSRVALLLEDVAGSPGDCLAGCTAATMERLVDALASLHARWWRHDDLARHRWLPPWGRGTDGTPRPHRRAAQRFARRAGPFLDRFAAHAAPGFRDIVHDLTDSYEDLLDRLADLPRTLIHADLHVENMIFRGRGVQPVIIDWQSVSAGPAVYDLARLVGGELRDAPDRPAQVRALVARHHAGLTAAGAAAGPLGAYEETFRAMLRRTIAGFVSGYGRDPATLAARERALIEHALSPAGLAGVAVALLAPR